jgi:hypothetical protein
MIAPSKVFEAIRSKPRNADGSMKNKSDSQLARKYCMALRGKYSQKVLEQTAKELLK